MSDVAGRPKQISVVTLPRELTPQHCVEESLVILIHHRSLATIVTAFGEGASSARVFDTVFAAKRAMNTCSYDDCILGGEKERTKIPGFQRDVSPLSYLENVRDKTLLLVTTNGTRAVPWVKRAKLLVLGSFLNMSAVIRTMVEWKSNIIIACAGVDRCSSRSMEDELCASLILHTFIASIAQPSTILLDNEARKVLHQVAASSLWATEVRKKFLSGPLSKELEAVGRHDDLDFCIQIDRYSNVLPVYNGFLDSFMSMIVNTSTSVVKPSFKNGQSIENAPEPAKPASHRRVAKLRVIIVRHGAYENAMVHGFVGQLNPPLSAKGRSQAGALAEFLAKEPIKLVICSPALRATTTAEFIAAPRHIVPVSDNDLSAVHRGDWAGLTADEVEVFFPQDLTRWVADPNWKDHGGESYNQVTERINGVFNRLRARFSKEISKDDDTSITVCVVGHCSTVASVLAEEQSLTPDEWVRVSGEVAPGSATLVEYDLENPSRSGRVIYVGKRAWSGKDVPMASPRDVDIDPLPQPALSSAASNHVQATASFESENAKARHVSVISVIPLPKLLRPQHNLHDALVILIDVLRMTSTAVTAFGEGLSAARLFSSVMEVRHAAATYDPDRFMTGGEKKRVLIPGFDRDNSPSSYTQGVSGKTALLLTTNGTRAMPWIRKAKLLAMGSFLNASAVVRTIIESRGKYKSILLVCSGTERGTVRVDDDELCALYILRSVISSMEDPSKLVLDDTATSLLQEFPVNEDWQQMCQRFRRLNGAEELFKLNLGKDVDMVLNLNRYKDVLPVYHEAIDMFLPIRVHYNMPMRAALQDSPMEINTLSEAPAVVRVFLVRHGGVGNSNQLIGRMDMEMSAAGVTRSDCVAQALALESLDTIASSPCRRTRAAAEKIAKFHNLVPEIRNDLSDIDFGDWTGLTLDEVQEHFYEDSLAFASREDFNGHGGESISELTRRIRAAFFRILRSVTESYTSCSTIGIVTHEAPIRAILADIMNLSWEDRRKLELPTGCISLLEYYPLADRAFNVVYVGRVPDRSRL